MDARTEIIENVCYVQMRSKASLINADGSIQIPLTPTEYRIIECFLSNKGIPLSLSDLARHVWKSNYYTADRKDPENLKAHITRIRKKMNSIYSGLGKRIETNHGYGTYTFQPKSEQHELNTMMDIESDQIPFKDLLLEKEKSKAILSFLSETKETKRIMSGFETTAFYRFLLNNAKSRLWILGRKNKKLFGRDNINDIKRAGHNRNLSIEVLFLSPETTKPIIERAQNKRSFMNALLQSIEDAEDIVRECGIESKSICRFYIGIRNTAIIVLDNIVFFEPIQYDENGLPKHLTNSDFFATSVSSDTGSYYLQEFQNIWNNSFEKREKV